MIGSGHVSQTSVRDSRSRRLRLAARLTWPILAALVLFAPSIASAEILVFTTGRTMSVASRRLDNDRLVVTLRDGGEASFPRAPDCPRRSGRGALSITSVRRARRSDSRGVAPRPPAPIPWEPCRARVPMQSSSRPAPRPMEWMSGWSMP